jgi:hypothetical protein
MGMDLTVFPHTFETGFYADFRRAVHGVEDAAAVHRRYIAKPHETRSGTVSPQIQPGFNRGFQSGCGKRGEEGTEPGVR